MLIWNVNLSLNVLIRGGGVCYGDVPRLSVLLVGVVDRANEGSVHVYVMVMIFGFIDLDV